MALTAYYSSAANGIADRMMTTLAALIEKARKQKEFRRTVQELNSLSNRELADLGLHRSEIYRVARESVFKG